MRRFYVLPGETAASEIEGMHDPAEMEILDLRWNRQSGVTPSFARELAELAMPPVGSHPAMS